MKKVLHVLLWAVTTLSMTSCLDILEDVSVNKDGSGTYTTKIDASKMAEQMEMLAAMDTTGNMLSGFKHSLDSTFAENWEKYKKVSGISNVKIDSSTKFVYVLTMDFKDFKSLNAALNLDKKNDSDKDMYSWEKGKVTRKDNSSMNLDELSSEGDEQKEMMKGMLQEMKYTVIIRTPEKIKSASNAKAVISEDKKTATIETNLLDVSENKVKLGGEVIYKK